MIDGEQINDVDISGKNMDGNGCNMDGRGQTAKLEEGLMVNGRR